MPRAGPAFRRIRGGEDAEAKCGWEARAESVRNILCQDGHTITQLSAATRRRYGSRSPYFIPPSFLYQLRSGVTPHVCQIVALSESTGYRFVDWLRMFGFDLHQIPRLQIRLHPERTTLVTPMEDCFEPFLRAACLRVRKRREFSAVAAAGRVERRAPISVRQDREQRCSGLPEAFARQHRTCRSLLPPEGSRPRFGFHESSAMAGRATRWTGV